MDKETFTSGAKGTSWWKLNVVITLALLFTAMTLIICFTNIAIYIPSQLEFNAESIFYVENPDFSEDREMVFMTADNRKVYVKFIEDDFNFKNAIINDLGERVAATVFDSGEQAYGMHMWLTYQDYIEDFRLPSIAYRLIDDWAYELPESQAQMIIEDIY